MRRRARSATASRVMKVEILGHKEDPEAVAVAGGKQRTQASQPPFSNNEKARLVHVVASDEFRPCVEVMLRGTTHRYDVDDKLGRVLPFRELALVFNNKDMVFENFFEDHEHGDEDLRSIDPNDFKERPENFPKGLYLTPFVILFSCLYLIVVKHYRTMDTQQGQDHDHEHEVRV